MDPIEQRVRDSLRARAEGVEPTPSLYQGVQQRIGRRQRLRVASWSLAGVAAIAAAAVIVPTILDAGPPRSPEVADTPEVVESPAESLAPGDPTHALLALEDGQIVIADLATGDRDVTWGGLGEVSALSAAPGSSFDSYQAAAVVTPPGEEALVVTMWQDGDGDPGTGGVVPTSTLDLPGATGQAPSVAISPDGRWLAYTGTSQLVDAAPAVYVVPLDGDGEVPGSLDPDLGAAVEIHTVTVADELDAIDVLIEWSGPVADEDDLSRLRVRGAERQGALVLQRTGDGFQVQQRETYDGTVGDAIDVSSDFVATDEAAVFALEHAGGTGVRVRLGDTAGGTDLGVDAEAVSLDARGRTALLVGGGTAVTLRFLPPSTVTVSSRLGDDVVAGALLGGLAPSSDAGPDPVEEEPSGSGTADLGDGLVVADDRTVSLIRPDGSSQELVTFPTEGESTVVAVAVRPGSTATDLTVAITTRAEGTFDARWLRVVDGEVATDVDPVGTNFPAPPIEGANGFPLGVPDLQDGRAPAAVWSPEGDLLAAVARSGEGAPLEVRTIGWNDDGPSDDPNLAATFELADDRSLTVRSWVWTDDGEGATREGGLLLIDDLAGEAFTVRLDRQGDGAPAMPASNPLTPVGEGVFDLVVGDGGTFDGALRPGPGGAVLEVGGASFDLPAEATGPRVTGRVTVLGGSALVVLDPAAPLVVDLATGEVLAAPIGGEVVSADAIR
ncbi:MAG: hypothetical protein WD010_07545 [Nitriliruptor sp.]